MGDFIHYKMDVYRIMFGLEWRMVFAQDRVILMVVFRIAKQSVHTLFLSLTRYKVSTNDDKTTIITRWPRVTIDRRWRQQCITRRNNCNSRTRKAISNLLGFIHGHIQSRSYKKITYPFPNCSRLSLGMDKWFHTTLYWTCDYISMPG